MPVFRGSAVALVTPFHDGAVDYPALKRLIGMHLASRTDAIVCCATTGEAPTLSIEEKRDIIDFVVREVDHRIPVIASTGTNDTASVIEQSITAEALGADALLVVAPYYNKPSPDGLYAHFKAVSDAVSIPILVYNIPGRTGVNIKPETMQKLLTIEHVVGTKEASGNIEQIVRLAALCPECEIYAGNDDHVLPMMSVGALGVISTIANFLPGQVHDMTEAFFAGDIGRARELQLSLIPAWAAAFSDVNPIPVKAMLASLGWIEPEIRLPLVTPRPEALEKLNETLRSYGLLG